MKLLAEIFEAREAFSTMVVLTYNLDLAWFESLVERTLRRRGVRRFLILADARQVSETLEAQAPLLRHRPLRITEHQFRLVIN